MISRFREGFKRLLEAIVIILMATLTVIVIVAVVYRKSGASLSWYDEIASVLLAWLTYYGAALAALHRSHIGFSGLIKALKPAVRIPLLIIAEVSVIGFFILLAWVGADVLVILKGDTLVSVPIPTRLTQSVIPIGSVLFVTAEVLGIPEVFREAEDPKGFRGHKVPSRTEADKTHPMEETRNT